MNDESIARFWDNFINKSKSYGVTVKTVRWHVKHAERYIKTNEGVRHHEHGAALIEQYLSNMGRNPKLHDWQLRQVITSLQIVFVELVKADWADSFPWQDHLDAAVDLPEDHATIARDKPLLTGVENAAVSKKSPGSTGGLLAKITQSYPVHVNRLITEIRMLQYSIRN